MGYGTSLIALFSIVVIWIHIVAILLAPSRCLQYNDGTTDAGFFNHNYFLYQTSDRAHDRFHIVPWDMDNAMKGSMGVGRWDQPVCSSNYHDTGRCARCAFDPTRLGGFGDPHLGPSCWKMIRAYTRALRSLYIDAAERLLEGPLQPCRLQVRQLLNCSTRLVNKF